MIYGYIRVSSATQNVERQLTEMLERDIDPKHLFIDYQSGKNFDRRAYQSMKKKLKTGDLLYVKSIDRLGRDYKMIIDEWSDLTKNIGVDIVVIDMPLLDTRVDTNNLVGTFISDIVLQILSFVAQNERENIRQRQAEGIRIAKEKGIHFGRLPMNLPSDFEEIVSRYGRYEITLEEALALSHMSRASFYKYSKSLNKRK